jgi:hypothetical protein
MKENFSKWIRRPRLKNAVIALSIVLLTVSSGAIGAPGAPSGYNVLTCEVKSVSLDEGHSLMTFSAKGVQTSVPGSADHLSHIECLGTIESMPDKSFKASGYCAHVDREGEKWIDRWWNDSTMKKGRWEVTGVSGKWKGFRGTGTFVYTDLSTESACRGVSYWEFDR